MRDGNDAYAESRWREAGLLRTRLRVDPSHFTFNARLHYNRASAFARLHEHEAVLHECSLALELHPQYAKALLRRGASRQQLVLDALRAIDERGDIRAGGAAAAGAAAAAAGVETVPLLEQTAYDFGRAAEL